MKNRPEETNAFFWSAFPDPLALCHSGRGLQNRARSFGSPVWGGVGQLGMSNVLYCAHQQTGRIVKRCPLREVQRVIDTYVERRNPVLKEVVATMRGW